MKFVLTLKHWQLFLLTFGIPFALYIVFFITMFITMFSQDHTAKPLFPVSLIIGGIVIALAWIVAFACLLSWNFNVATGLFKKLPIDSTLKIKRFYFAFFFPVIYLTLFILCISLFAVYVAFNAESMNQNPNQPPTFLLWFVLIIPLHLLAMACLFYVLYFIAKALKSVELQREAELSEYVAEFVLAWFFMIGVWFIQPRINQIFSEEKPTSTSPNL